MFLFRQTLLFSFIVISSCESFNDYYNYVINNIDVYTEWELPTNNEKLFATHNSSIKYFGSWDFIIIGGGSAGSLLAGRMSEVSKWNILLLEAGNNQSEFSDVPGFSNYLTTSGYNWGYFTSPQSTVCQGMINNSCSYPRGKALGGSAVTNKIVNTRGIPKDYDDWVKLGNAGWSYDENLPFFKSFEKVDFPNADPFYYGSSGNIHVNYTAPPSILSEAFINANKQNGLPEIDYNGKGIQGVSRIQFHIKGNKRDNSAHGYVDPAQDRPNLKIELKSFVTKILIHNKQAYGVEFIKDGQKYQAKAKKEIILSAGAINSPQILLLSGIGPEKELLSKGIKPKNNLPAVGKYLKDHPIFLNLFIRTNQTAANLTLRENLKRYLAGMTPLTNAQSVEHILFMNTKNNSAFLRNIELVTSTPPLGYSNAKREYNFNNEYVKAYGQYNKLTDLSLLVVLLKPKSVGSVTLKSNSPVDFPVIDIRFFSDPNNEDIETMYEGIKYALSLTETPAFKSINATYISTQPGCEHLRNLDDREYWYCAIRHATYTTFHPIGTTRMGISSLNSVVNSDLKVHHMEKLRVVDAGVMPTLISGHTNSPTYMIAEKTAYKIKLEYGVA